MTSTTFVLLSGALSFGVPLALAMRELFALSAPSSGGGGPPHDEPPRRPRGPLPDCLLPRPAPIRVAARDEGAPEREHALVTRDDPGRDRIVARPSPPHRDFSVLR